jgi:hypothetical protein
VHSWSTSPLQTDPRIVRVPGITHPFATHKSVEAYRHPPAAEGCGLGLVHDRLECVVRPEGEATEVVMHDGKRVKVYDAFNYVWVSVFVEAVRVRCSVIRSSISLQSLFGVTESGWREA